MSGSNNQITYEEAVEFLPAYALGALESDDELAVEQHLRTHPDLQQRLDNLLEVTTALAHSAPPLKAPAGLKASVLSRAQSAIEEAPAQRPAPPANAAVTNAPVPPPVAPPAPLPSEPVRTNARPGAPPVRPSAPPESVPPKPVAPESAPWWAWLVQPRTWQLSTAALALVLALVTVTAVQLRNLAVDLQAQLADAQQRLAELESANDDLTAERENIQAELTLLRNQASSQDMRLTLLNNQLDLLAEPDRVIPLALNDPAGGENASGSFYAKDDGGVLLLRGLAALAPEQTYELWLIPADGEAVPAGLFDAAAADSSGELTVWNNQLPLAPDEYATVGISIEPAGGSPSPTGPIVLLGTQT